MKIAIAMSGGVDSSVAAALLKEAGHDVTGLTMRLTDDSCTETDAAEVARQLGIPHHVADLRDIFQNRIIDYFCREYCLGRTPNPCVLCNKYIKFGALWEEAVKYGADLLATGHYAKIEKDDHGRYVLKKGQDVRKDQSYFLYQLTQEQLGHTIFPVGELSKTEVRKIAAELGLATASRPESREICFIPDDDRARFMKDRMPESPEPGAIRDERGKTLGQHRGIASYTIGQRKGLGIAAAEPLYVTAIAAGRNEVIVGTKEQTYSTELTAEELNWIAAPAPEYPMRIKAKIRYRQPEAAATLTPRDDNTVYLMFDEPQMAITPGQAVVFYNGDRVLGGGTILKRGR